jgi:hypothetical protein
MARDPESPSREIELWTAPIMGKMRKLLWKTLAIIEYYNREKTRKNIKI